ncbi:PepSY domain-containing protein [Pseudomonas sp. Sample_16]|uniref:PepSY domain-containing protein n=1 Tax=Pseudomonas sp. Sample_16 TaxID=2448263 RepID=UPI001032DA29|nr:PepSY domain-containing protein [Pseudomonas sp. Sample_16]
MKTALALSMALPLTVGLAQADDLHFEQVPQLVKEGKIKPLSTLNQAVMKLHPGATITDTDLDNHFNGYTYEVEVLDTNGAEWDVDLNAATGAVLKNQQDN